ncbi:MAG TPA: hypothetical protein VK627_10670 [Edaphobacter sp.]|nr:hypothetical protein [Edaphobacter sp.]
MSSRRARLSQFALLLCFTLASLHAFGQDSSRHGRKYKAPPETSHIEVEILKKLNGKPISNAAVIFNPFKDGKDLGNLEVKTGPDGKAAIDVIPTGSTVRVQIIANGFSTYAQDYLVDGPSKEISISMVRPQEQVSAYQDNDGKASSRKPGVQEPVRPTKPATKPAPAAPAPTQDPTAPTVSPKQ